MIPLEELRTALKIPDSQTSEDSYIEHLEAAAVEFVERETHQFFGAPASSAEFVLCGSGSAVLYLPARASAVTAVSSRGFPGGDETVIGEGDPDGWELRIPPGKTHGTALARKGGNLWWPYAEYIVTATVGYQAGLEPADIRSVVVKLVGRWFEKRVPLTDTEALTTMPPDVQRVIDNQRKTFV